MQKSRATKSKRKIPQGAVYNKERTKQKIIDAVGIVIKLKGFKGLNYSSVAKEAGVDRKLIYEYFTNLENLTTTYLRRNDYRNIAGEYAVTNPLKEITAANAFEIAKAQFDYFENSAEMQQIVLWELNGPSESLNKVALQREVFDNKLFKLTDKHFKGSDVNFWAISGIILCSIYYMILYAHATGRNICEIDIRKKKGRETMLNAIKQITEWTFEKGNK